MSNGDAYTFSAVYARDLLELAQSLGIERSRILDGLAIDHALLADPEGRVSLAQFQAIVARVRALRDEPSLGLLFGLHMRVPMHGYLGFAIMSSATMRDALALVARYIPIRSNTLRAELLCVGDEGCLYLDEVTDLGEARTTVITAALINIWQTSQALTQARIPVCCELTFEAPQGAEAHGVPSLTFRYDQPRNGLRFAAHHLELTVPNAHLMGFELAREQCERALLELEQEQLVPRVRALLWRAESGAQSLQHIAHKTGMSASTLKRKLKAAGVQFSDLLDEAQRERACGLLRIQRLSIEQVAEKVGYADVSNFGRAFRRWTGVTPAAYRKSLS